MSRVSVIGFGLAMFVLGAYAAPLLRADTQGDRPSDIAARALLPEQPSRGKIVSIGGDNCRVIAVLQEWVKCEERPTWRNLYNGTAYSVLEPPRQP